MNAPAGPLAARIEEFERTADPRLVLTGAALAEAEQAMRACTGEAADAAVWRRIGSLHLARYRLDGSGGEAAMAGVFFAAAAVADPGGIPETMRRPQVPSADTPQTWAELVEEVLRHVDPDTAPHVGLLLHALIRRAVSPPSAEVCERLGEALLQETMEDPHPAWASEALAVLGGGLLRLFATTGEPEALDDAVHVHLRAALGGTGRAVEARELAAALGLAVPDDAELIDACLTAVQRPAGTQERSRALLALFDLAQARATASAADADLLAFIRIGQATLDFWHDDHAHPRVIAGYAAGLVEWYVVTGDRRSLEAGHEMLEVLGAPASEIPGKLGRDQLTRLDLLADRRRRRWRVAGDPADLELAIQTLRQAVARTFAGHPARPRLLSDLAGALVQRAARGDHPGEAIAAARSALAACGEEDPLRARVLLLLGRALRLDAGMHAVDEAVTVLREALTAAETATALGKSLAEQEPSFLAEAYGLLSELLRHRSMDDIEGRDADLDEAVTTARQAVEAATRPTPDHPAPDRQDAEAAGWGPHDRSAARQGAEVAGRGWHEQAVAVGVLAKALLQRFRVYEGTGDFAEALVLVSSAPQGDRELRSQLRLTLQDVDGLVEAPGEELAQAATRLALVYGEEETARVLLRIGERHARVAGEAGPFLAATAVRLAERERFRLAIELLVRAGPAFNTAGEPAQAADTLCLMGRHHQELGEWDPALRAFERAAAAYHELGEIPQEATQLGNMAAMAAKAGEPRRAVELHLRAAALCAGAGLDAEEAAHRGDAADACLAAGDPAAALECAGRARELHLALGQAHQAAELLIVSARACAELGRLPASADLIATCAAELEALGAWDDACQALDSHARHLYALGQADQAADCETSIVDIVRRHGQRREPADEWLHIARRRTRRDPQGARRAFELAERAYNTSGHADGAAAVRYDLGVLGYGENAVEQAAQEFATAAEAFARLGSPVKEAAARALRGVCLMELDRFDAAATELGRALELAAGERDLTALFSVTLAQAELSMTTGRLLDAEAHLLSALGLATADPVREAVVRERMARLASRTGDVEGEIEALALAAVSFHDHDRRRLAALASVRLGLALEAHGDLARARAAIEGGLAALEEPAPPLSDAPYEVMAAGTGELLPGALLRLEAIHRALNDPPTASATPDRAAEPGGITEAVSGAGLPAGFADPAVSLPPVGGEVAGERLGGAEVASRAGDAGLPHGYAGRMRSEEPDAGMSESRDEGSLGIRGDHSGD